jgi:hypothetical protein
MIARMVLYSGKHAMLKAKFSLIAKKKMKPGYAA